MDRNQLAETARRIRMQWDAKDMAREKALTLSREVIRNCADTIRGIHREEYDEAVTRLAETAKLIAQIADDLQLHPELYFTGFVQDAHKEYAEAHCTLALIRGEPLPIPEDLKVEYSPYLRGLGEAVGELRRHILDRMRIEEPRWGENMLGIMDDIYYLMVSFDYPEAISGGLKRATDQTRSIIERTRGDLTNALRQQQLEDAMERLEKKIAQVEDLAPRS